MSTTVERAVERAHANPKYTAYSVATYKSIEPLSSGYANGSSSN